MRSILSLRARRWNGKPKEDSSRPSLHGQRLRLLLACLLATLSASTLQAGSPDSVTAAGNRELALGNLTHARELFTAAIEMDEHYLPARLGLGKVAIQEARWDDALDEFEEVIEQDSANLSAHYYTGIACRETGTMRAFLIRSRWWNRAEEEFSWIIGKDSAYEDVLYQYAVLQEYRGEFLSALELGHRQLALRTDLPDAALGLCAIYRHYLAEEESERLLTTLRQDRSGEGYYFLAEALRRQGQFGEAWNTLVQLANQPGKIPGELVALGFARLSFAMGDAARGEAFYWYAVDHISSPLGVGFLFNEIKYIVTDAEWETFRALRSDRQKSAFFYDFWDTRDPTPAAMTNPRLAEHYRRLFRAERDYEYFGFRTWFNNPEKLGYLEYPKSFSLNHEFNDKGMIYIRHGEPDDISRTSSEDGFNATSQSESWLYKESGESPRQMFHFAVENSAMANWRLVSLPSDPAMLEDLAMWDVRFHELANASALGRPALLERLREEARVSVNKALSTDNHTWKKETRTFDIPHMVNAFRGEQGRTLLNIPYAIPMSPFSDAVNDSVTALRIEVGLSVGDARGHALFTKRDTLTMHLAPRTTGSLIAMYRCMVPPDSMKIAMHVRPLGTAFISTWAASMRIPRFPAAEPLLSDVQFLLPSSSPGSIDIHGMRVRVSPFNAVPRSEPLLVYWEIYNLTKDLDGKTRYTTQLSLKPKDADADEEGDVVYEESADGREEFASGFARLDVSDFDAGLYDLIVRVTDRKRVYTFERSRLLQLNSR